MRYCIAVVLALWQTTAAHSAARASERPRIETVEGAKTVLLQKGINLREAGPGEEIKVGERIRTDGKTKVTLSYPDGSRLDVYPNSDLEIEKPKDGVQSNQLRTGEVKGAVEKEKPKAQQLVVDANKQVAKGKEAQVSKPKVKFIIRTKTAVMGVRGTEFVAAYNAVSGLSQFHTLTGAVEVATSPAQLLGGTGVEIGSGQFVQATEQGLSAVQSFNPSAFLSTLGNAPAVGGAPAGAGAAANAASLLAASAPGGSSSPQASAPPPKAPPPPPPPPLPPAELEKKAAEAEKERPRMHLVSFALGGFMSENPRGQESLDQKYYRALQVHWTPYVPLPGFLDFLYVRGSFGATLFEHYSLNNGFLVHDYQLLAGTSLLNPIFVEAGGGHQAWRSDKISAGILTANGGLILSQNGRFNRVFVGVSKFLGGTKPVEIRAGIGIQFF